MDENKIAEMFRGAVPDLPPASFTQDDVRVTANRQRLRRNRVVGGTALGVALVLGGVSSGLLLSDGSPGPDGAAAAVSGTTGNAAVQPREAQVPGQDGKAPAAQDGAGPNKSFPSQSPEQGGTATGEAGPGAGSTPTGCPKADGELAAALASELPSAAGKQATRTPLDCPPGVRGASFALRDGNAPPGVVSILLIPKGVSMVAAASEGTVVKTAFGPDGNEIMLVSQPPEGSTKAPFGDDLAVAAKHIAAQY